LPDFYKAMIFKLFCRSNDVLLAEPPSNG